MTYRDDLDALAARQTSLQVEVDRKQRELAHVKGLLAEARRVEQAESYFERAPDLRRRHRRHLIAGALLVTLGTGAALGAAVAIEDDAQVAAAAQERVRVRAAAEQMQRMKAELEALRVLGLIPVVAPEGRTKVARADRYPHQYPPAWLLGSTLPARGSLWKAQYPKEWSVPHKDQR